MAEINVTINRIDVKGAIVPPTVDIYIADYYERHFTILEPDIPIDSDGNVLLSPLPTQVIDSERKYVLRAVNRSCGYTYEQNLIPTAYCPIGYVLSDDGTQCLLEDTVSATPPQFTELAVDKTNVAYTTCGSYVYEAGFSIDGTGSSDKIDADYEFWHNLTADCSDGNITDGPLNRTGIWAQTTADNQDIGYSVCINKEAGEEYFIGLGCDNKAIVRINGTVVLDQNPSALDAQYSIGGACFKVWHIYPITSLLRDGYNVLELVGHNISGSAAFGAEVYNNTAYEISHSNSYGGISLVFSSKEYSGRPIVVGSNGIGYSCPDGYSLDTCASPYVCRRIMTAPVQYG